MGLALLGSSVVSHAAPLTPGNLTVYRIGTGTGTLVATGNPVFLDEYTPAGVLVQSIPLPETASGTQKQLIASGTSTSEGMMTRSTDGRYIVLTGYAVNTGGSASLSGTASASVPRTVGRVDAAGAVDTSTALTDFANANNPRGVTSTNGTDIWVTGAAGGARYTTFGASTSTQISTTVANIKGVSIYGGQMYLSTSSGSTFRLGPVGTGIPATAGQTITNLPGFPLTGSPYAFVFADLDAATPGVDTLYVADDTNSSGVGGIQKYALVGGSWVAKGVAGLPADTYRGLFGNVSATGTVTLYAVRKGGSTATGGGEIVSLVDSSGYNATLTGTPVLVATAAANTALRGIAAAPLVAADLSVAVSGPPSADVGADFSYTLTVFNGGSADASGVAVRFTLPAGLSYSSASATGFSVAEAAGVVDFTGGSVPAGASRTLTVVVSPAAPGTFTAPAWAAVVDPAGTISETDEGNNKSPLPVTTLASLTPDLTVGLAGPALAVKDVPFDYTLTATNGGLGDATGVSVRLTLPAGVTYQSASAGGFTASETSGVVTFSGGTLAAGASTTLTVTASASPSTPTTFTAAAGAAVIDPGDTLDEISEANNASTTAVNTLVRLYPLPAASADSFTTLTNAPLTVNAATGLLSNDPASARSVVNVSTPAHGTVTVNPDGSFTYTPVTGYTGPDTFTYTVTDAAKLYRHNQPALGVFGGTPVTGDGYGSAFVPVPGTTDEFYGLSDRGPNVDGLGETSKVFPLPNFVPGIGRFKLVGNELLLLGDLITFKAPDGTPYSGRFNSANPGLDQGFDINGNLLPTDVNGFDSEGLVAMPDGTFWVSDEYGPFITHFDATGRELQRLSPFNGGLPVEFARRVSNRGMEGLALTPDGTMLVGMLQSGLDQPDNLEQPANLPADATKVAPVRILTYTLATGAVHEYLYMLANPNTGNKVVTSEIIALSNTTFLVDERDNSFPPSAAKKIFLIDLAGATDVGPLHTVPGAAYESTGDKRGILLGGKSLEATVGLQGTTDATATLAALGITPVAKSLYFDLGAMLLSLNPAGKYFAHDKIEGLALGDGGNTLYIANDSDFGIDALSNAAPPFTFRAKVAPATPTVTDRGEVLAVDLTRLPAATATATVSINVQPATDIAVYNGATVASPALTDGQVAAVAFGNTKLLRSTTRTFTVQNAGSLDLTGISVSIDGANATNFVVTGTPAATLIPGATSTFTVRFTPPATGTFNAVLHIASNDADESSFDVPLTATGILNPDLASLAISPAALAPVFNPDVVTYFANYPNDVTSVTLTPTLVDAAASQHVRLGTGAFIPVASGAASDPLPLTVGYNTITVRVTAADGITVNNYTITVNRAPVVFTSDVRDVLLPNTRSWDPNGVALGGTRFINLGLQGIGRVPSSSIDPATGESLGSISDMQISGFTNNHDGTWSGVMSTLPDRGYNTTIVNPAPLPPTVIFSNYAARINRYDFTFTPYTGTTPITAQNQIAMTFGGSTRFTYDHDGSPATPPVFSTGLLANGSTTLFGATVPIATGNTTQSDGTIANRLTLDTEGLVLDTRPGREGSGWIGDEYGAYIYHFNNAKEIDGEVPLPAALVPHAPVGTINFLLDPPLNGRRINQGMEGLCQSPDGTTLFGLLQSATIQDSGSGNQGRTNARLVVFDITGSDTPAAPARQYVFQLPRVDTDAVPGVDRAAAQSSIIALNNHQILILSRDGNGRGAVGSPVFKSILLADLHGATDINGLYDGEGVNGKLTSSGDTLKPGITPVSWTEALNMLGKLDLNIVELAKFGMNLNTAPGDINSLGEKWEALCLVPVNDPAFPQDYFLFIGNDNDFMSATGKYLDTNGVIQSYDAGLENDTVVLAYRVRVVPRPDVLVYNGASTASPVIIDDQAPAVDFGTGNLPGGVDRVFTIQNSGNEPLTLANPAVTVTGSEPVEFTIITPPAVSTLAPGETTTFTVRFTPSTTGARTAVLRVASSAPGDKASYDISVRGTGNLPPVAPPQTFTRGAGMSLKVKVADLLAACSDPNGGTLSLTGTGPSAQGAAVSVGSGHLLYAPATNAAEDAFTYTISDGQGGTATGTITIQTIQQEGLTTGATTAPGGALTAHFAGIPGFSYTVERSTNLTDWVPMQTFTAPANGLFQFTDNEGLPSAFYRLRYNPAP